MTEGEAAAVTVSIIALGVSVIALGFSGWHAITSHLSRTQPRRATFTIHVPGQAHHPWTLLNTGGSLATDAAVTIRYPLAPPEKQLQTHHGKGPVEPDKGTLLVGTENRVLSRDLYFPDPDQPGSWKRLDKWRWGARHVIARYAAVTWRDYKGRPRKGRIRVR